MKKLPDDELALQILEAAVAVCREYCKEPDVVAALVVCVGRVLIEHDPDNTEVFFEAVRGQIADLERRERVH